MSDALNPGTSASQERLLGNTLGIFNGPNSNNPGAEYNPDTSVPTPNWSITLGGNNGKDEVTESYRVISLFRRFLSITRPALVGLTFAECHTADGRHFSLNDFELPKDESTIKFVDQIVPPEGNVV